MLHWESLSVLRTRKKTPDWKWMCQFYTENIFRVMDHYSASYEEKLKLHFLIKQKRYWSPSWTNKLFLNSSKSVTSLLPSSSKSVTSYYWNVKWWEKFVGTAQKTERKEWQTALPISKNQLTCLYRWLLRRDCQKILLLVKWIKMIIYGWLLKW